MKQNAFLNLDLMLWLLDCVVTSVRVAPSQLYSQFTEATAVLHHMRPGCAHATLKKNLDDNLSNSCNVVLTFGNSPFME